MKVFTTASIRELDRMTCKAQGITSYQLMQRASGALFNEVRKYIEPTNKVAILAGSGNNGGDALCLARFLHQDSFDVEVFFFNFDNRVSDDCALALHDIKATDCRLNTIASQEQEICLQTFDIIIDGIFGIGCNRPVNTTLATIIRRANESKAKVFAIDVPSGFYNCELEPETAQDVIEADITFTFQQPKFNFFLPEYAKYVGKWHVLDIGIDQKAIETVKTTDFYTQKDALSWPARDKFSHKGTFGRAILIAGRYGMLGASLLAARACMKSGCGLLTVHTPSECYPILQQSIPECIYSRDTDKLCTTSVEGIERYSAIGIGPAIGFSEKTEQALYRVLKDSTCKIVIDADALTIISKHLDWLRIVSGRAILTPHPKEFDRLFGESVNCADRIRKLRNFALENKIAIILKGANSCIGLPNGECHFNSTGNPGMATAGSGDVLTGLILSLLSQNFSLEDSAIMGVYLHGLAGDIAANKLSEPAVTATDIVNNIPYALRRIYKN